MGLAGEAGPFHCAGNLGTKDLNEGRIETRTFSFPLLTLLGPGALLDQQALEPSGLAAALGPGP